MDVVREFAEVDRLLDRYGDELGSVRDAYRNHIYRVLNYTLFLNGDNPVSVDALEVAGFFHDLDFVLHGNGAYLEPSSDAARAYLDETDRVTLKPLVTDLIVSHHKVTRYLGEHGPLVDYFRRADLIDLSLGIIRSGVKRSFIRDVKRAFPGAGFHALLAKNLTMYALRHPLKPMPMMRI